MIYSHPIRIEFNHCDAARIVFYPRYFEMTNSVAENFFREVVQAPYEELLALGGGVPTARIEVDFKAPSRLGEVLDWQMEVLRLGNSALDLRFNAMVAGTSRLRADLTLVYVNDQGHPQPWTTEIRDRITAFMEAK